MTERMNEMDKIELVMSEESIEEACKALCIAVRQSYQCPSDRKCRLLFDREVSPKVVKELRECVWSTSDPGVGKRKEALEKRMNAMVEINAAGKRVVKFKINDKAVCKSFFKVY